MKFEIVKEPIGGFFDGEHHSNYVRFSNDDGSEITFYRDDIDLIVLHMDGGLWRVVPLNPMYDYQFENAGLYTTVEDAIMAMEIISTRHT